MGTISPKIILSVILALTAIALSALIGGLWLCTKGESAAVGSVFTLAGACVGGLSALLANASGEKQPIASVTHTETVTATQEDKP